MRYELGEIADEEFVELEADDPRPHARDPRRAARRPAAAGAVVQPGGRRGRLRRRTVFGTRTEDGARPPLPLLRRQGRRRQDHLRRGGRPRRRRIRPPRPRRLHRSRPLPGRRPPGPLSAEPIRRSHPPRHLCSPPSWTRSAPSTAGSESAARSARDRRARHLPGRGGRGAGSSASPCPAPTSWWPAGADPPRPGGDAATRWWWTPRPPPTPCACSQMPAALLQASPRVLDRMQERHRILAETLRRRLAAG